MFWPSDFIRRSLALALLAALFVAALPAAADSALDGPTVRQVITNAAQFLTLPEEQYLEGCDFHLTGVVTLVDPDRELTVLQDASGAVAINLPPGGPLLQVGERATVDGTNCGPYMAQFPSYPYRPSGATLQHAFEGPENWGEYNLTRMRGFLHPPVTGEYTFWIASDNSSELWLSPDAHPGRIRKIASIPRFGWTLAHEWSRYPSQRSEPILLEAGQSYYIEAISEQTTVGENLSVAWQGPANHQGVISGDYLTPWQPIGGQTNGILREYWTNFLAGDLTGMTGPQPFASAITAEHVAVSAVGPGKLPAPEEITPDQTWSRKENFRWVQMEGLVSFIGAKGGGAILQLSGKHGQTEIRLAHWRPSWAGQIRHARIQVQGVCEGVPDENDLLTPGLVWASSAHSLTVLDAATTNADAAQDEPLTTAPSPAAPVMQGFYSTRGVVTFSGRVLGRDYHFVQEDTVSELVSLEGTLSNVTFAAGQWLQLGGALHPGKPVAVLTPLVVDDLGFHAMPTPNLQPLDAAAGDREGRWSEVSGVVHAVSTNGALAIFTPVGRAYLWLGQTASNRLASFVDAKVRARGVLLLSGLDAPMLLVPSTDYIDVEELPVEKPFAGPAVAIANLGTERSGGASGHRVKVAGQVTYRDAQSLIVQDDTGGARVWFSGSPAVSLNDAVEAVGFPAVHEGMRELTESQIRRATNNLHLTPLDLTDAPVTAKQAGMLAWFRGTLLDRKNTAAGDVLEIQQEEHLVTASLPAGAGGLPDIAVGSSLRVVGVIDNTTTPGTGDKAAPAAFPGSLNILLRNADDVTVLSGPPWWTWRRTAMLVGALLFVLAVTLLWVHLLQRRLARQRAAQLAFSRQVLAQLEEERRRIAANLHDSLGQILLAIKNHALLAIQRPPDESAVRARLDEISGASSMAIEEVRQITHGLRPYQLDRLGLTQSIRASINQASANGAILFASRVEDIDGVFDKETEIHVYRIVQEAVTNVVKHSGATEAAVVIRKRTASVSLSVRDNGRGFDTTKPAPRQSELGYGLIGITERVRVLSGTFNLESRPGAGTNLTVEVPLPILKT